MVFILGIALAIGAYFFLKNYKAIDIKLFGGETYKPSPDMDFVFFFFAGLFGGLEAGISYLSQMFFHVKLDDVGFHGFWGIFYNILPYLFYALLAASFLLAYSQTKNRKHIFLKGAFLAACCLLFYFIGMIGSIVIIFILLIALVLRLLGINVSFLLNQMGKK